MGFGCRDEDEDRVWVCGKCYKEFPEDPKGWKEHYALCTVPRPACSCGQEAKIDSLQKQITLMEAVATAQEFADWLTNEGIVLDYGSNVGRESVGDAFIRFLAETASLAEVPE